MSAILTPSPFWGHGTLETFLVHQGCRTATNIRFCPRNGITILVADDFEVLRRLVRQKLLENGFQAVAEAADGLEAVKKTAELQPDLVLLDIAMPKLSGIEAAARIRLLAPQSKVLFVSQNTDSSIAQLALSDGAGGYVLKSRIDHELLPAIEAVLQGKRFISPDLYPA